MVAAVAWTLGGLAAPATAQPSLETAPAYVPRRTAVLPTARVYADPRRPAEETGLRDVSMRELVDDMEDFFRADPRYETAGDHVLAALLEAERSERQQDLLFVARQSARFGEEHRRAYHLASALDELDAAARSFQRTVAPWTRPAEVADAYHDLTLVHLERARAEPEAEAEANAAAASALRSMIRLDPARVLSLDAYPASVVQLYHQAYLELLLQDGAALGMRAAEAEAVAAHLEVDQVAQLFAVRTDETLHLTVQVWDAVENRWVLQETLAVEPAQGAAAEALLAALSRAVACQPLVAPPDPPSARDQRTILISAGYDTAFFLRSPTRRSLHTQGAVVGVSWLLNDSFGLHFSGSQWVARRDRDGDLIGAVDTTRATVSAMGTTRVGWLRFFAHGGFDLSRHGRIRATTAFWCKVSEGEPLIFEAGRSCTEDDITNLAPAAAFGLTFGAGADAHLGGPFWFRLHPHITLYVTPRDERSVNLPAGLEASFVYRF